MIVPMSLAYIVVRKTDQDRLLKRLGGLGLLHVTPVDPEHAVPDAAMIEDMADLNRALRILLSMPPRNGPSLDQTPMDTAREAVRIEEELNEKEARLKELERQARELTLWGDVRVEDLAQLRKEGLVIHFFAVPEARIGEIEAECVEPVATLPDDRRLVAVISPRGTAAMPEAAEPIHAPHHDRPSLLKRGARIDAEIQEGLERLSLLATQVPALERERNALEATLTTETARRSGLTAGDLFAVQGWVPSEQGERLGDRLWEDRIPAAVHLRDSHEGELPPTLIRYAAWTRPIKALFNLLGTFPGYREMDLSPFFMAALPVFAAMLIGDAGYGLCIALASLLFSKRIAAAGGRETVHLLLIFGLTTLLWGVLTATYFGITPETLARAGGFVHAELAGAPVNYQALWSGTGAWAGGARIMAGGAPLWRPDPEIQRFLIIKVSLIVGCLHLTLAHVRRMTALFPDQCALAELGWVVVLGDMLVLVWHLLFVGADQIPVAIWWVLLGGFLLPVSFQRPQKSILRRVVFGLASSLLPLVSTFSDTMSYLRLFAVGMASYYIAMSFNMLGARLAETATWAAAAPVLIFGHGLNIGLAAIAIFAHGIRLNMLEFSNNAGVQWAGYAYRPYALNPSDAGGGNQ